MGYDVVRQGVDPQRVSLLLLKWPLYAFKLLRRGRFATIAQLRKDAYYLNRTGSVQGRRISRSDSEDFIKGLRTTLGDAKTAASWAVFLLLVLFAERLVPQVQGVLATLIVMASLITILVGLSSIARESSSVTTHRTQPPGLVANFLAGAFFVASTLPFSLPWVIAFFFPRQCILFFTAWAAFGAVINEVSVLVSHAQVMKGLSWAEEQQKKNDDFRPMDEDVYTRVRPQLAKKRTRKTTEQRIATVSNFTLEDRKDLEDYIISDEGLKWWAAFLAMQACVSAMAVFLRLFVDTYLTDPILVSFALIMSMCMICESFWMTYAAGGRWLHFRQQWKFFQPFSGGQKFATLQVAAWFLFFVFMLASLADLHLYSRPAADALLAGDQVPEWSKKLLDEAIFAPFVSAARFLHLDRLPAGSVALCGMFAELLMMVSLPLYQGPEDATYLFESFEDAKTKGDVVLDEVLDTVISDEKLRALRAQLEVERQKMKQGSSSAEEGVDVHIKEAMELLKQKRHQPARSQFSVPVWELVADAFRTAWLSPIVLTLVKPEVTLFLSGFILTKFVHRASFFGLFDIHLPYLLLLAEIAYLPTFLGNPRRSGHRRWWSLRGTWVYDELSAYWYMNIIRERELNPNNRHIFGYHPHGMFPMGASYLHNTSMWMDLFPNINPFTLTATVTHIVPLLREVTQYNGGLEVTQESFVRALLRFKNVLLVPGGQHEMLLSSDDPNEVPLSAKHKGFVRLALLSAAENPNEAINLVPIYAFGESDMVYNVFPASLALQRWLVAKLRLNPAFLPVGRFNLAGVPKRVPITFVVGAPIPVPVVSGVPTEAQVDLLAARYYTAVEETFEKHKQLVDGYESTARIAFVPPLHEKLSKVEFEEKWSKVAHDCECPLSERKKKREHPPYAEYAIAIVLTNLCLLVPYLFFAD